MVKKDTEQISFDDDKEEVKDIEYKEAETKFDKMRNFGKKAWEVLNNKEIGNQATKTMLSSVASIAGVKSFYDVPEYFRERFKVRGFRSKGGVRGSVDEIVASFKEEREKEEGKPRKEIVDLQERLLLTKDAKSKGSEARKIIAEVIRQQRGKKSMREFKGTKDQELLDKVLGEYDQKLEWNEETKDKLMKSALDDYTETKVNGIQASREALNTAFVASGAYGLRGLSYGFMAGVERAQRISKEARREGKEIEGKKEMFKAVVIDGVKETFQEAAFKGEGTKQQKALKAIKSYGSLFRFAGIGYTMSVRPEHYDQSIEKVLDTLDGKTNWSDAGRNFVQNIERLVPFVGEDKEADAKGFGDAFSEMESDEKATEIYNSPDASHEDKMKALGSMVNEKGITKINGINYGRDGETIYHITDDGKKIELTPQYLTNLQEALAKAKESIGVGDVKSEEVEVPVKKESITPPEIEEVKTEVKTSIEEERLETTPEEETLEASAAETPEGGEKDPEVEKLKEMIKIIEGYKKQIFDDDSREEFEKMLQDKGFSKMAINMKVGHIDKLTRIMAGQLKDLDEAIEQGNQEEVGQIAKSLKNSEERLEKMYGSDNIINLPPKVYEMSQAEEVVPPPEPEKKVVPPPEPEKKVVPSPEPEKKVVPPPEPEKKVVPPPIVEEGEAMPKPEPFQIAEKVEITEKDSIWSVSRKYLESNKVFQELSQSGDKDTVEALQTYNIDRVKDIIVANPQAYGLAAGVDVDKLSAEQLKGIDWEKAFANTFPEGKGLTEGLTEEQIESIVKNNETLRTFFQEHPNAPRTSDNYEAILDPEKAAITGEEEVLKEEPVKIEEEPVKEELPGEKPIEEKLPIEEKVTPEPGTEEFYQAQAALENTPISKEERLDRIEEIVEKVSKKIKENEAFLEQEAKISPETKISHGVNEYMNNLKEYQTVLGKAKEDIEAGVHEELFVKNLLPPEVITPEEFESFRYTQLPFKDLSADTQEKINSLFFKHLGLTYENFTSIENEDYTTRKMTEVGDGIKGIEKDLESKDLNIAQKALNTRDLSELNMIQKIWDKFGPITEQKLWSEKNPGEFLEKFSELSKGMIRNAGILRTEIESGSYSEEFKEELGKQVEEQLKSNKPLSTSQKASLENLKKALESIAGKKAKKFIDVAKEE